MTDNRGAALAFCQEEWLGRGTCWLAPAASFGSSSEGSAPGTGGCPGPRDSQRHQENAASRSAWLPAGEHCRLEPSPDPRVELDSKPRPRFLKELTVQKDTRHLQWSQILCPQTDLFTV